MVWIRGWIVCFQILSEEYIHRRHHRLRAANMANLLVLMDFYSYYLTFCPSQEVVKMFFVIGQLIHQLCTPKCYRGDWRHFLTLQCFALIS